MSILLAIALLSIAMSISIAGEIPGLEVKAAVFTSGIDNKDYVDPGLQSGIKIKSGPVYLWTVLSGTDATLAALKRKKERGLPIRHKWTYLGRSGDKADRPDEVDWDPEEIKVGMVRRWPGLSYEVWLKGFFDWRTWTGKKKLRRGTYRVEVMSDRGSLLQQNGVPCEYYFDYLP